MIKDINIFSVFNSIFTCMYGSLFRSCDYIVSTLFFIAWRQHVTISEVLYNINSVTVIDMISESCISVLASGKCDRCLCHLQFGIVAALCPSRDQVGPAVLLAFWFDHTASDLSRVYHTPRAYTTLSRVQGGKITKSRWQCTGNLRHSPNRPKSPSATLWTNHATLLYLVADNPL